MHVLEFWIGQWTVFQNGQEAGRNVIEAILDGCAITKHCSGSGGQRGTTMLDRTMLTREPGGCVRQLTEVADDGGRTWIATFDG